MILSLAALLVCAILSGCKPAASEPREAENLPGLSQAEIEAKIVGFAAQIKSVDPSTISPQDDIYKDIGFDYLDPVELTLEIEAEYGLSVPDEDVEEFTTIAQFATYVKKRKSAP